MASKTLHPLNNANHGILGKNKHIRTCFLSGTGHQAFGLLDLHPMKLLKTWGSDLQKQKDDPFPKLPLNLKTLQIQPYMNPKAKLVKLCLETFLNKFRLLLQGYQFRFLEAHTYMILVIETMVIIRPDIPALDFQLCIKYYCKVL